jgi:PTS system mannose-specific IIC component
MILNIIIVSAAGGILCLDRVVLQAMISRPIVAAPVIGLILGDPYTGLIVGAFLELFWIDRLPIGAYFPPDDTIAAILITASSIESAHYLGNLSQGLIVLAILIFLPFGILARRMELWLCRGNEELADEALSDAYRGDVRSIGRKHLTAILKAYLFPAVFILVILPVGIAVMIWTYPRLADWTIRGLTLTYSLLPLIGTAVALNTIHIRGTVPVFCAVFLAVTVIIRIFRDI